MVAANGIGGGGVRTLHAQRFVLEQFLLHSASQVHPFGRPSRGKGEEAIRHNRAPLKRSSTTLGPSSNEVV